MSNLPAVQTNSTDLIQFDDEQTALIKRMIAKDATDDELALFLHQCKRTGLDPLAKQIYFQKYKMRNGQWQVAIITGIDGYRLVADRTGKYAGNSDPVFGESIKVDDDARISAPSKATVTVQKLVAGQARDFTATAHWSEYYPGDKRGHMWRKMPCVMLAKVAEAAALRKAFPADLSGVYTADEMQQTEWSEPVIVEGKIEQQFEEEEPTPDPSDNGQDRLDEINVELGTDKSQTTKAQAQTNGVDWRKKAGGRNMTIGTLCTIANNGIPYYSSAPHAFNSLKDYPFPEGVIHDQGQRLPQQEALDIYDWLDQRARTKADQEAA